MSIIRNGILSADLDVPVVLPTLNLDFANSQSLDKRITFSRGSIGTRVNRNGLIETIPANQPRFDFDPVTGECKGLLIEESRSNLLVRSEDFSLWSVFNGSVQSNVITAPDGNTTADKLVENSASGNKEVSQGSITFTSGTSLTFSCFVKAGERTLFRLAATTGFFASATNAYFNLSNGTVSLIQGGITSASIIPYPNGWYRCVATMLPTSSGSGNVFITLVRSGTTSNYFGDGTSGLYLWGAQVEAGAFPTSYIPTTASIVPRSADNAQMTGTNFSSWYNQSEGTVFCSFKTDGMSGNPRTFQLTGNNQNERLDHRIAGNVNGSEYYTGGISFGRIDDNGVTNPSQGKITVSQNSRSRQFCMNGRTVKSATIPNAPAVNTLNIGNYNLQATYLNGTIRKLAYYPKALSPAELQYLTQ